MSDPYAALVPAGGGDPYSALVPKPSLIDRAESAVGNAYHAVTNFFTNSPASQIVAKNKAAGKPQPDAFGSVAEAVPDEQAAAAAINSPSGGAFRRATGREALPTGAGALGFGAGAAAGGLATAPAEAIPFAGQAINLLGALGGGLFGAYEAHKAAGAVQSKAISALPLPAQQAIGQDAAQQEADRQQHPYATFSGELAPSLLLMRPGFSASPVADDAPILTRLLAKPATGAAVGATLGGGQEAAREKLAGENLDPEKIAIASGVGALENRPTALGSKLFNAGGHGVFLGAQRTARAAGFVKEAVMGRSDQQARQPFDAEATATPVPQEQLPPPAPGPAPANDPYSALVPTAPEPAVAPPVPGAGVAAALPAPQSAVATEGQPVEPQPSPTAPISEGGALGQPQDTQAVRTPAGTKIAVRPEVVDSSTLNSAEGALQNRDRSRDTSALQTQDIVSKFDPELLGHDPSSDRGAPIVAPDNTVLSGNGRMLALNQIYDQHPDKADAYRQFIESQGHSTDGIDRPVLIRRVAQDMTPDQARQFVIESNKDSKLELSPVERAQSDADNVTPEMLAKYAGGDLNSGANAGFVQDFTKSLTAGELGNVIGSDRRLTTTGTERIENAVVAKAYDHPKLLEKLMESSHNEIRAITSSLANVAPAWAAMREGAKAGDIGSQYDITSDLSDAAMRVAQARRTGEKPADILTQQDAFDRLSPTTEALIRAFYNPEMTRAASVKSVTQFLHDYTHEANGQTEAEGLFGKEPGKAPQDILNHLLQQREGGGEASLFDVHEGATSHDTQGKDSGLAERDRAGSQEEGQSPAAQEGQEPTGESRAPATGDGEASPAERPGGGAERAGSEPGEPGRGGRGGQPVDGRGRPSGLDAALDAHEDKGSTGAYDKSFHELSSTNRPSDLRSAVEHLGLSWDDFNLKPPPAQMQLLQRAIREKLGIKVTAFHKELPEGGKPIQYRLAIDQMLDGFHNISGMAAILGLPEKAMSLGGTLTLELRKTANFYGAFYPNDVKIALPGRGQSFAHEWSHALDYYLLGQYAASKGKGLSGMVRSAGTAAVSSPEIAAHFADLMNAMFFDKAQLAGKIMELEARAASTNSANTHSQLQRQIQRITEGAGQHLSGRSDYYGSAKGFRGEENTYWTSPTEMMARAFEAYVAKKAADAGMSTEAISRADADYLSNADERLAKTFPKGEERDAIFDSFDHLFQSIAGDKMLGEGEAATIPTNPAKREDVTPPRVNAFRNIVRNELEGFADARRAKEKAADQPKDPKGLLEKANDIRHFGFSGMAAEMRALGRRWNSKAIAELHDLLVSEPGRGNRLQRRDLMTAQKLRTNRYANLIRQALVDHGPRQRETVLSKEEAADVRSMMTADTPLPMNSALKPLASRLREISDQIWHDMRNAGFDIGYARNGYLPRIYDRPKAQADQNGFLQSAQEVYEAAGLEADDARRAAGDWYLRLMKGSLLDFDRTAPHGDFLKGRTLPPEADAIMSKYMVNEPIDLMRRYATSAAHRIEWAKRFGTDNSKLNALYDRMVKEGVDQRDVATIKRMADIVSGNNPMRQKDQTINAVGSAINTIYGTYALLGRAVFQHIAEPLVSGVVTENPMAAFRAFADNVAGLLGTASAKERREVAEFIGLMDASSTNHIMADRFGGSYDDPVNWQRMNSKLFYNTGLTWLTKHKIAQGQGVINAYLITLSNKLLRAKEGSGDAKEVLDRFNELGIRDPQAFAQWMSGQSGLPSKAELAEGLDETGKAPWAYDWITATKRLSSRITQEPHTMTKPLLSHKGVTGRLLTGIMAFHYAHYDTVLKPILKRNLERAQDGRPWAATNGVAMAAVGLAILYGGYLATNTLRVYLTDRERWREEEAKGTLLPYLEWRTLTTFVGNPMDPEIQAVAGLKYNRSLGDSVEGPAAGNILQQGTKVIKLAAGNSRRTNTAEHNALSGAYSLLTPWAAAGVGALPGGPLVSGAEGVAQGYMTSQQGSQDFASAIVGPKDGRPLPGGGKVHSGPTAYDRWLEQHYPKKAKGSE